MLHFVPQTITITDRTNRSCPIEALVALYDEDDRPVGLAVHPIYTLGPGPVTVRPDEYAVSHVHSGVCLHRDPVASEAIACRWLELIAPLTDWTQSERALRSLDAVRLQVWVARIQAKWEEEDDGDVFTLPPARTVSTTFSLETLTALIEWISYGMEYVNLTHEAKPTLDTLLAIYADLAQQRTDASTGGRA
ncbi:MAG TPA: hypothetical protein VIZ18_14080 [Ktedonobacteraceae bacterium]